MVAKAHDMSLFARIAMVYGALFFSIGMFMPFFPVWLKSQGMDDVQVAWVLAMQSGTRMVASPAVSHLADRLGRLRPVMLACAAGALAGFLWLEMVDGFQAIMIMVAVTFTAFAPLMPLTEAYAVTAGRRHGLDYGRMRLWGSVLFIAGNLFAGVMLDILSAGRLVWLLVIAQVVLFLALMSLPPRGEGRSGESQIPGSGPDGNLPFLSTGFVIFLLSAALLQSSHALVYGFSALHWKAQGYSGTVVGLLWGVGVVAEIILFWFSGTVMTRLGAIRLLGLAGIAGCVRWTGLSYDPPLVLLFLLQMLHGLSFGAAHLGAIEFIRRYTPQDRSATAQAMYGAVAGGIFMTIATWASGLLYKAHGAGAWLVMAGMSAAALLLVLLLKRVLSPRERVPAAG